MENLNFNKFALINSLLKIGHGDLDIYVEAGLPVAMGDPDLFAHYVAWNSKNSKIYDTLVALPVIALRGKNDFWENALCCIAKLGPREVVRAYKFSKKMTTDGKETTAGKMFRSIINRYLNEREYDLSWWNSCVLSHRNAMKTLYAVSHRIPKEFVQLTLFGKIYPEGSVFDVLRKMKNMSPKEAAGHIYNHKIPFPIAIGAVPTIKNKDILMALITSMTANELVKNAKMLMRLGAFEDEELKTTFEKNIATPKKAKKANVYKAQDVKLKIKDKDATELIMKMQKNLENTQRKIEGTWLMLVDCSLSMNKAIEQGRKLTALLSSRVDKLTVIFFNYTIRKVIKLAPGASVTYDQMYEMTKTIVPDGSTSIGCGVQYAMEENIAVDGIIIISDGGDNTNPLFYNAYLSYCSKMKIDPIIYHLRLKGDPDKLSGLEMQKTDLHEDFDEYAFLNLLTTVRAKKYELLEEILSTPLLTFDTTFKKEEIYDRNYKFL